jgi:hypothetical protein
VGSTAARTELQGALAAAEVHPLLCAVAHLAGDLNPFRSGLAPDQLQIPPPERGLGPEHEAEAREMADQVRADDERS